jgi:hypothetical protein
MRAVPTQEHRADPTAPAAGKSGYEQSMAPTGLSCGIATGEMVMSRPIYAIANNMVYVCTVCYNS